MSDKPSISVVQRDYIGISVDTKRPGNVSVGGYSFTAAAVEQFQGELFQAVHEAKHLEAEAERRKVGNGTIVVGVNSGDKYIRIGKDKWMLLRLHKVMTGGDVWFMSANYNLLHKEEPEEA